MKYKRNNGSEIAPCIVSKVKHALGLISALPRNNKKCSKKYWDEAIDIVVAKYSINTADAKSQYYNYI